MSQFEFENEIEVMVKVKFTLSPGYSQTWDEPGIPHECEDIEIQALDFGDQPKDIRESITDMAFECVETERQGYEERKAEAQLERRES